MAKFRKKSVVIEAFRLGIDKPPPWFHQAVVDARVVHVGGNAIITTLEGAHIGNQGDWIIQGVAGELYPCKDEIFKATYEMPDGVAVDLALGTEGKDPS